MTTLRLSMVFLVLSFLTSCGGPEATPTGPVPQATGDEAEATSPWEGLTAADLAERVRAGATARIREVEPELDLSALPRWMEDPSAAPALGDRVCEQLLNLAVAAAAVGEDARAVGLVRLVRAKARNRNNAYAGTTWLAELARRSAERDPLASVSIRDVLGELPPNRFGSATVVFQIFQNPGQVQARIDQLHRQLMSLETMASALYLETILAPIVEHRALFLEAVEQVRAAYEAAPERPAYAFSTVDLTDARDAEPVVVAVWDTGVAGGLFEEQLFTNHAEIVDGQDDDENGLVDDRHGVIADPTPNQTGLTFEPGEAVLEEYAPFLAGTMDLRAGLASTPAAQRVLALMGQAQDAAALDRLEQNLNAVGEWAHGTHVAGILLAGVPQARMAVFRSAWAGEARLYHHRGPTDEELAAERRNVEEIARFIQAHRVRVVNASLGFSRDYVEGELRHESDRYRTDAEVRARAEEIQAHRRESWRHVFERCPDTLFVVAAGNSNRDVAEYGEVPAALTGLENLLVVGAVDRYGDWATFTNSHPDLVTVFDLGVEVPSVIPNGETVPLSGTSMASPNVANLAAKMFSVNPNLSPVEVAAIIRDTGEPIAEPFYGRIAHEERAVALARERR